MIVTRPTLFERFLEKFDFSPSGCWEWKAGLHTAGYGAISVSGKKEGAHRVAYELFVGPIGEGLCVLHTCDNPPCVNPEHLFLGTLVENNRDRDAKGRHGESRVMICPAGHEYNDTNTYRHGSSRHCKKCNAKRCRDYRERKRAGK